MNLGRQHSHSVSDPGHSHSGSTSIDGNHSHSVLSTYYVSDGDPNNYWMEYGGACCGSVPTVNTSVNGAHSHTFTTNSVGTGISVGNVNTAGGSVSGTNAPYIQYLTCKKN